MRLRNPAKRKKLVMAANAELFLSSLLLSLQKQKKGEQRFSEAEGRQEGV